MAFFLDSLSIRYDRGHCFINKGDRNSYEAVLTLEGRVLADGTFGNETSRFF
jgi:hypothetical protein